MPSADLRQVLAELGYHVIDRCDTWSECFVASDTERWRGKGRSADEAFADAIAQMLPSALARRLLERTHQIARERSDPLVARELFDEVSAQGRPSPRVAPPAAEAPPVSASVAPTAPPSAPGSSTPSSLAWIARAAATPAASSKVPPQHVALAFGQRGVVAVVDGVKPTVAGGTAARAAAQILSQVFEAAGPLAPLRMRGLPALLGAVQRANREIHELAKKDPKLKTMQASVAAVVAAGGQVGVARVGTATVHRLRGGVIERLVEPTESRAGDRLGAERAVDVETSILGAEPGDVFLVGAGGRPEVHLEIADAIDLDAGLAALRARHEPAAWAGAMLAVEQGPPVAG